MIKETCSCGANFEYQPTGYNPVKEADAAREWRKEHKHESQTVARESPKVSIQPLDVRLAEHDEA